MNLNNACGIACNATTYNILKEETSFEPAKFIVDNRIKGDLCEVYYELPLWLERVREQNKYDAETKRLDALLVKGE